MENKFQFVSLPTTTMYGGYLTVACEIILCPKLNKYLFTDNISKLGCVIQQSQATHVLHECKTDKHDSVTSYIIHHTYLCVPLYKCTHMCDSFIRALYACWKLQAYWLILWNQEIEHLWVVQWQSINCFFLLHFFFLSFAACTWHVNLALQE